MEVVVVGVVLVVVGVVVAHRNISAILAVSQVHRFTGFQVSRARDANGSGTRGEHP